MHDIEPQTEGASLLPRARLVREVVGGAPELTPEAFMRAAHAWPRGFWARGDHWFAWAGEALRIEREADRELEGANTAGAERFEEVRRRAETSMAASVEARAPIRFHGGLAFAPDRTGSGAWEGFPSYRFTLPALEAARGPDGVELLLTVSADDGAEPRRARDRLLGAVGDRERGLGTVADDRGPGAVPAPTEVRDPVGEEGWNRGVHRILGAIESGEVRKVVLARTLNVTLEASPDPLHLLRRLRLANPRGYAFFVEPSPGRAFFGAAPELLGALDGREFHSTAVAGTIRRGETSAEDEALARTLLASEKDRAEHRIGVEEMCERLARVVEGARVDRMPRVVRLNRVQHLRTDLTVRLPQDGHVLSLVGALHPTAAVCGDPREAADRILREQEAFARGWYAAPVGWFDGSGDGEFAPGLRSAVLQGRELRLFAGAGIVRGSEPRREWEETSLKFDPVLQLLGASAGR